MTSRSTKLSLSVFVVGALGVAVVLVQRANDAKMRELESELQKVSKTGEVAMAGLQATERVVPALIQQVAAVQGQPPVEPAEKPAAQPPAENVPYDPAAAAEAASAFRAKQATLVEDTYSRQAIDRPWAQPARDSLNSQLSKNLGTSTLDSVDCRENLCKARLTHQDLADYEKFLGEVKTRSRDIWKGPFWLHRDPMAEGEVTVRNSIYFAREGTEIPTPQP